MPCVQPSARSSRGLARWPRSTKRLPPLRRDQSGRRAELLLAKSGAGRRLEPDDVVPPAEVRPGWQPYGDVRYIELEGDHREFLACPAALQQLILDDLAG